MKPVSEKFILLFMPKPNRDGRRMPPLALLAISTWLEREKFDIHIFHSNDKEEYLEALDYLDQVICVGISAMTGYQVEDGLAFANLVRKRNKDVPIIWGGIHPTIKPIQTAEHPLVDIVVKCPGEDTFTELVYCLTEDKPLADVLGIVYKKDGRIIENQDRPIKPMSDYPPLPYHLLDDKIDRYIKKNEFAERSLAYISSSGCPFRCAFCYLGTPSFQRKWDYYSAERVVDEIEFITKKYSLDGVDIRDSNFFVDIERVKKICRGLIDRNIKIVITNLNGRSDQLAGCSDADWELFKNSGIRQLLIGAESGDQKMLDLINKQNQVENTLKCEIKARQHGINIINSFMTSFPPATDNVRERNQALKSELNSSVELIRRIFDVNPVADILLFFLRRIRGQFFLISRSRGDLLFLKNLKTGA